MTYHDWAFTHHIWILCELGSVGKGTKLEHEVTKFLSTKSSAIGTTWPNQTTMWQCNHFSPYFRQFYALLYQIYELRWCQTELRVHLHPTYNQPLVVRISLSFYIPTHPSVAALVLRLRGSSMRRSSWVICLGLGRFRRDFVYLHTAWYQSIYLCMYGIHSAISHIYTCHQVLWEYLNLK